MTTRGLVAAIAVFLLIGCADAPSDGSATSKGASIYLAQCKLCHGADGKMGVGGAKDLTLSTMTEQEMIVIVSQGKGAMMAYGNILTPAEITEVVAHVRSLAAE